MTLEFVLSQWCTWYRMFSEATGLMNNKADHFLDLPGSLAWCSLFPTNLLPADLNPDPLLSQVRCQMNSKGTAFILNLGGHLCSTISTQPHTCRFAIL